MSLLFADIYDGIRCIRITKGVSERDILNFVQDKVGGCMNVGNVLKTIRTLKKLCEDGVLIKKGKRYMFAPKECRKSEEDDDDDDDDDDDECQEEIQPQVADSCDECDDDAGDKGDDQEEEEEEDDDDDEEDEDDDDDDDDDECDEKDVQATGQENNGKVDNPLEMTRSPVKSKESFMGSPNSKSPTSGSSNGENGNGTPNCLDRKVNRAMTGDSVKKAGNGKGGKRSKGKTIGEQETGDCNSKGSEAIAFCVRDFIDSLGRPDSEDRDGKESKDKTQKSEVMLEENMDLIKSLEFGKEISLKKRGLRNKRNAGRSRSSGKDVQIELYHCLAKGPSDEIGAACSDLFQESADVDMEIDQEKEDKVTTLHRNFPNNSGDIRGGDSEKVHDSIDRGYDDLKVPLAKKTSMLRQMQNNECGLGQMTWYPLEEREKEIETLKRSPSSEDEREGGKGAEGGDDDKTVSLCSVCEKKKKRNP